MRVYRGRSVDSSRWERFEPRPDDVIISTPSKCGTTWMQHLVGMILLDRVEFGSPLSAVSPWLDVLMTAEEAVFEQLAGQSHRRFIKTHTPLDGVPRIESWTYITVFRHPLDAALSMRDHDANMDREHAREMITKAIGELPRSRPTQPPEDATEFLRYWIADDSRPDGSGPHSLSDYANSLHASWSLCHDANVHLFHYDDLWRDLDGQVARLADILGVDVDPARRAEFAEAATLDSMRARAQDTVPYGDQPLWRDAGEFFKSGGRREWPSMLTTEEVSDVVDRLESMVGHDASQWALHGGSTGNH